LAEDLERAHRELAVLGSEVAQLSATLQEVVAAAGLQELSQIDGHRTAIEHELLIVVGASRRAAALLRAHERIAATRLHPGRDALRATAKEAENAVRTWRRGSGARIAELLKAVMGRVAVATPAITAAVDEDLSRISLELAKTSTRLKESLSRADAAEARSLELEDDVVRARVGLLDVERRIEAAAGATPELATALSVMLNHLHRDECPVCGRDYSEVSERSLADLVRAKIRDLSTTANRLSQDTAERSKLTARVAELEREREELAPRLLTPEERLSRQAEASAVESLLSETQALQPEAHIGATAIRRHAAAVGALEGWTRADAEEQVLTADVAGLEEEFGVVAAPGPDVASRITKCFEEIEGRRKHAEEALAALTTAHELSSRLEALNSRRDRMTQALRTTASAKTKAENALRAVKLIRKAAGSLEDTVTAARARVISEVFNVRLNSLWRDLFVRLAPDESFIPSFDVPASPSGRVRPILRTVHRSGREGGAPGVMLSSGNLNTAALTLFLALHLTVRPKLPWLILDDPVQSMDDVHIANFAALLRTLSKQHGRQVDERLTR
jgi:exonuclease SbcC